jgi:hypothetical protein
LLSSLKKETQVSIYLFNDCITVTKPSTNAFNVLFVIKWHSNASGQDISVQKYQEKAILVKNPRKISENHLFTFSVSYLRDSWFEEIEKAVNSWNKFQEN